MNRTTFAHFRGARLASAFCLLPSAFCLLLTGCRQQMAQQPRYEPFEESTFFADGQSARPLLPGTIARGGLRDDVHFFTGRRGAADSGTPPAGARNVKGGPIDPAHYFDTFPAPVTREVMERGRERYGIYCAMCHDSLGTGKGKIVERGFTRPPSLHEDRLRQAPVGYLFDVITNGYGAMPDYAAQIPPADRWAIVAYVRVLQLSQNARLADLPEAERKHFEKSAEKPIAGGKP